MGTDKEREYPSKKGAEINLPHSASPKAAFGRYGAWILWIGHFGVSYYMFSVDMIQINDGSGGYDTSQIYRWVWFSYHLLCESSQQLGLFCMLELEFSCLRGFGNKHRLVRAEGKCYNKLIREEIGKQFVRGQAWISFRVMLSRGGIWGLRDSSLRSEWRERSMPLDFSIDGGG